MKNQLLLITSSNFWSRLNLNVEIDFTFVAVFKENDKFLLRRGILLWEQSLFRKMLALARDSTCTILFGVYS